MTANLVSALVLLAICGSAKAVEKLDLRPPKDHTDKALVERLRGQLSPCLSSLGPRATLPLAKTQPKQQELPVVVLVSSTGAQVEDGYRYWLGIHASRKSFYLGQNGGLAGNQVLYGPIPESFKCTA